MSKKKILIIDDEVDLSMLLKSYFSNKKYEVYYAYSLDTGIKLLEEIHPDIVFLDNNLPDGSGWSTADQILEKPPGLQLNLISTHQNDLIKKEKPSIRIWEKPLKLTELCKRF